MEKDFFLQPIYRVWPLGRDIFFLFSRHVSGTIKIREMRIFIALNNIVINVPHTNVFFYYLKVAIKIKKRGKQLLSALIKSI